MLFLWFLILIVWVGFLRLVCKDIFMECYNKKYEEICAKREKVMAIIICCHYLDIAFYKYIYDSLGDKQGIGYYVRQLI